MCRQVLGWPPRSAALAGIDEPRLQLRDHRVGDRLLRAKNIGKAQVERFRPQIRSGRGIDEVNRRAQPIARLADAAGQQHRDLRVVVVAFCHSRHCARLQRENAQRFHRREPVDDFLPQTVAEIREVTRGALIRQGQHCNRVLTGERRPRRAAAAAGSVAIPEDRSVAALWQLDDDRIRAADLAVIPLEPRSQPARLHAYDRVGARVERRILVEHLHADDVFLELVAATFERFADDEAEESLEAIGLTEGRAGEHTVELLACPRVSVLLRNRRRCSDRHDLHLTPAGISGLHTGAGSVSTSRRWMSPRITLYENAPMSATAAM